MSRPWFRFYHEFSADPKVQLLSFDDQRHFVVLLCLKCNGILDSKAPSPEYRDRMISKALGVDSVTGNEVRRRLTEVGLIEVDWQPIKWDSRQYEFDVSTDRVRRFRDRKRGKTLPKRSETVSETDEIQNRTDTEQNRTEKRATRLVASKRVPKDFTPDLDYALSLLPNVDASAEAQKFKDWEFKKPRSDWPATWRTWVRTCKDTGKYSRLEQTKWM